MNEKMIFAKHRFRFGLILFFILLEAGLSILFPLFIGFAIDDVIHGSYAGAVKLGVLGIATLVVGVGRRVFDSRFYAEVYREVSTEALQKMEEDSASVKSARLGMIRELVEFLENLLPELINSVIGLVGVVIIIAGLNLHVFYGSIITSLIVLFIYRLSSSKTLSLNKSANDEAEKQVDVISKNDEKSLSFHLKEMMRWNIKLSDLEALNFFVSWLVLISFLVVSIIISVNSGIVQYGALFSLVMYVFQYMENVINLPMYYQNWLRLKEIRERLLVSEV